MNTGLTPIQCPQCHADMEPGFVNAGLAGILWTSDPTVNWFIICSRKVRKLQKDWWGFPKLRKDKLPACRCPSCMLVIIRYNNEKA